MPSHKPSGPASVVGPAAPADAAMPVGSVRPAPEAGGSGGPARVLIVDDHPAVRFGLRLLLEREGLIVAGEADCLEAARQLATSSRPDLVIVDLSLGDEDGLDLLAELGRDQPGLALLVYSMHEDAEHIQRALGAGARGYFAKRESAAQLGEGLRSILAGAVYLSPRIAQALAEARTSASRQLSLKEQEIFDLLGEGLSGPAIAARLDLSPRTVESYFARMLAKLGLGGTRELRQQAIARRPRG